MDKKKYQCEYRYTYIFGYLDFDGLTITEHTQHKTVLFKTKTILAIDFNTDF